MAKTDARRLKSRGFSVAEDGRMRRRVDRKGHGYDTQTLARVCGGYAALLYRRGRILWRSPVLDTKWSAFVYAEVEQWGRN